MRTERESGAGSVSWHAYDHDQLIDQRIDGVKVLAGKCRGRLQRPLDNDPS